MPKTSQTHGHAVGVVRQVEAQNKWTFSSVSLRLRAIEGQSRQKIIPQHRPHPCGEKKAMQHYSLGMWCLRLSGEYAHTDGRCHGVCCKPSQAATYVPTLVILLWVCGQARRQHWVRRHTWPISSPPWLVQTAALFIAHTPPIAGEHS